MTGRWLCGAVILVALATTLHAQNRTEGSNPIALLKAIDGIAGLVAADPPSQYDSSNIDQFDAGLSSRLKLYGLKSVIRQQWKSAGATVETTLFEMIDSGAAYGIYTLQQYGSGAQATSILVGAASFRQGNQLHFWQSNYIVRITGPSDIQNQIAEVLSRNIPGRSRKPPVSEYLPPGNLVEGTEKYLLDAELIDASTGLNPHRLGFDSSAEAATATYRVNGAQAKLLLVLYPTQHIAKKYADAMQSELRAAFTKRAGPLLAIVYSSNNEKVAASILDNVSHEFKVTWDEPPPGLGVATMLITIFTFIGLSLAFTAIAGVGFGGLRVYVKSRFPNRVFDRPEAMEIIQLKLPHGVTSRRISGESRGGDT